ncbi:DUF551 domain-containing protein [Burkholderia cenocepacia]|uniref:DUF551 domain-containing protein n=1 Tax=Burkholderia cenocepacia TaxID=95486 RepID=UPI002AC35134|nr:DUF551 domain-containing protein [Burkholderia cenocepacia]
MTTTDKSRADALTEAVTHTIDTIGRQLDLIAERAPGNILDKVPVVRSLTAHKKRLEKALAAVEQHEAAPADDDSLTLSGAQLLEALEFIAPDRDAEQLESKVTIQRGTGHTGHGMYCWSTEYPEEGAILLDGTAIAQPAPSAPLEGTGNGADGRALYERLHTLMPEWYPDAWDDLLPKYRDAYATAALSRAPRTDVAGGVPRLDDADIDVIAESMPGGLGSFMKQWGWRQFARAVEDEVRLLIPSADAAAAPADAQAAEPVAYVCSASNDFAPIVRDKGAAQRLSDAHGDGKIVPLYAAPQPPAQADAREGLTAAVRATIMDAARSLSLRADELKESNTAIDGTWCDADEKAAYDTEVRLIERLRAHLAAHPGQPEPLAEVTGWQPIETAPKDGTEVMLLFDDEVELLGKTRPRVRAASWFDDWTIPYRRDNPPTHWMPLPAAPIDGAPAADDQ